jgi:hypothetical protein
MKFVSRITIICLAIAVVAGSGIALAKTSHPGRPTALRLTKSPQLGRPAAWAAGKLPPSLVRPDRIASIPKGYTVVDTGALGAANGTQTRGIASCPALTVIWGGGVFIDSSELGANVNSSFPSGNSWIGDVNNAGGSDTTFTVYAICAKQPRNGYSVQAATVTNSAGTQNTAQVTCPGTSKILGGGGFSSSKSTLVNINSTIPVGKKSWRVDMNNATAFDTSVTAYAVCGAAKGRTTIVGSSVTNPAGTETFSTVFCPPSQVPSGGGEFSSSSSTAVNLNGTFPVSGVDPRWDSYEHNASASSETTTSYVVCVGAP